MKVGIIGLGQSGKSSLFHALTGQPLEPPSGKPHRRLGRALVPDERVELVAELDGSKKITYAEINFTDPDGFPPEAGKSLTSEMLGMVRGSDLIALVIRAFDNPTVMHPMGTVDGMRDLKACFSDLVIQDLAVLEGRQHRVLKEYERGKKELKREVETLARAILVLENEKFLSEEEWNSYETEILDSYELLTRKNGMVVWNVDEETKFGSGGVGLPDEIKRMVESRGWKIGASSLSIEAEIMEMDESDRHAFLEDMGLKQTIRDRFTTAAFTNMNLIRFYTGGPREAAARSIEVGSTAYDAAGKVHDDIQRGFIRAEVMNFRDLRDLGSIDALRKAGKYRLEKKEYIVQDGDIIIFRFNV